MHQELSALVTGRARSLFAADLAARQDDVAGGVEGRRVLVIGGAGSIGAATVRALLPFRAEALHVVDQSENNLAELVRDLRSTHDPVALAGLRAWPLDFGSTAMHRLLLREPPYDLVLNFAALKHVRSEKDVYSLQQMLDTNVLKCARLLRWLAGYRRPFTYFCVSTDKAANPVNLMGASKRLMEHVAFSGEAVDLPLARVTSARFANVAFSDGSLLHGFLQRLQKRQPLAAPRDTRRYFVSLEEAGHICLLAAVCAPHAHVLVPRLDAAVDLVLLEDVATLVLRHHGFEPSRYDDADSARLRCESDIAAGRWPLVLTALDTSGEKPYEEFVGAGESAVEIGMDRLRAVPYRRGAAGAVAALLSRLEAALTDVAVPLDKQDIVGWIGEVVPEFRHVETGRSLDDRM
jgi:FlaA1/EpsC-like NDP-sugar epimerase